MKWPLSMSFAKLISRTADAGKSRYTLPDPGLLNPDTRYFWRVQPQDEKGVWGPWGPTWSFTPGGPAAPRNISLTVDNQRQQGVLRWEQNSRGAKPTVYRVYGSDEKAFSVSDRPYQATVGVSADVSAKFPANFLVETSATELAVLGAGAALPGANQAFYRVVAVDASGKRSGPSDYAAAPRPFIFSKPVTQATRGMEYRYPIGVIRSLGDLRTRVVDGRETMSYWDIERPRFELERGPRWLSVDRLTGVLSGTPDRPGSAAVIVAVALEHDQRRVDPEALKWGIEKVVSSETEIVGRATQSFVIEVRP
jgi:hypothetical protein